MPDLPTGKVTFFFTDIEGSTHLLQYLGDDRYAQVLADQRRIMRAVFQDWRGHEFHTEGDAFLVAFATAADAVAAAAEALRALAAHTWPEGAPVRVRVGLHTGEAALVGGGYLGLDVHRTNRVMSAGYGGQVVLSQATRDDLGHDFPDGVTLRDLGEHRLKDLTHPEHLYQLLIPGLPGSFPPPKTLDVVSNNLPIQQTSFIGREREIEEVKRLMNTSRLVTLMGPGGAGKSRLSMQVAADLIEGFKHGAWLVELAPLRDPTLVVQTIASTLGVREVAGRALLDSLIDYLQPRTLLLVVDNCEHLVESCALTLGALLRVCPNLRVLATSRDALGVAGEATYRIPPLARPDARRRHSVEELAQFEAVRLFVERAVQSDPLFALSESNASPVARITQRLDGIPLAIELAAAQANALTAMEIDARLNDRFLVLAGGRSKLPHHQTLRATIDWSYDLLGDTERPLFRRLSVFSGGFPLDAAEEICPGGEIDVVDLLDLLTHLVDKSLVVAEGLNGEVRYRMLETVRQYGQEKLVESEEAESLRGRHMAWFLELAEQNEPRLRGPEQIQALEVLEREVDNLRAALQWGRTLGEGGDGGMRLAAALARFWLLRGYLSEGRAWLDEALAAPADGFPLAHARALYAAVALSFAQGEYAHSWIRAEEALSTFRQERDSAGMALTLNVMGNVCRNRGDYEQAEQLLTESAEIGRHLSSKWSLAESLNLLGLVARRRGDHVQALTFFTESLALWREIGDKWGLASSLGHLGVVARYQRDYPRSRVLHEESLALRRELGDKFDMASSMISLGTVALEQEDYDRAHDLFTEALELGRELGYKVVVGAALGNLGIVAYHHGDHARAATLIEESKTIWAELDDRRANAGALTMLGTIAHAEGDQVRAAALHREALVLHVALGNTIGIAESLEGLAYIGIAFQQGALAVRLLGLSEALRRTTGTPIPPSDRPAYERSLSALRGQMDEQALSAAWEQGRTMPVEQAVEASRQIGIPNSDEGTPETP